MKVSRWRLWARWLLRAATAYLVVIWVTRSVLPAFALRDTRRDMVLYYKAARAVNAGAPLYTPRPGYGPDSKPFEYLYPPPFAALIAPVGHWSWPTFVGLWRSGLILAFVGYALCLTALCGRRDFWTFALWLAAVGHFYGSFRALALGQVDPVLWFFSGLGVWGASRARAATSRAGGAALGALSLVKIYGVWTFLALRRGAAWRQMWSGALVVAALGLGLGAWRCGFSSYAQWASAVLPVAGQGTFNPDNYSLSMAVLRVARVAGWHYVGGPLVGLPKLWLSVAAVAGPLVTLYFTRRADARWRVALVGCAAAGCAPLCWSTYLPLALLPVALAWERLVPREWP